MFCGRELRRFHDPLPAVTEQILALLGVDPTAYGIARSNA
jgi:hypothetical protein